MRITIGPKEARLLADDVHVGELKEENRMGRPKQKATLAEMLKITGDPAIAMQSKCKAHARTGKPCGHRAMAGCAVCHYHGGKAPQVMAAARRRLAATDACIRYEITADWVTQRLAAIADATIGETGVILPDGSYEVDLSTLTQQQARAIESIIVDQTGGGGGDGERKRVERVRVRLRDAIKALELLGRSQKMFADRVEVDGSEELLAALAAGRKRVAEGA
jgi:hypothetical protein